MDDALADPHAEVLDAQELLADDPEIPEWKRIIYGRAYTGSGQRKKPSAAQREEILKRQGNRCLYCGLKIGSIVWRGEHYTVRLQPHWDHFIPYVYLQTNPGSNWVLACHVCNLIKGCRMFESVVEAQEYIKERWIKKGYRLPILTTDDSEPTVDIQAAADEGPPTAPEPELDFEDVEPSYTPVPLELAKAAKVVCRRLANEMRPTSMSRVVEQGGNQTTLRAALMALIESGHVKRCHRKAGSSFVDYYLVRPYEVPREAEHLPEFTWERGGVGKVKPRKQRSRFPGREKEPADG